MNRFKSMPWTQILLLMLLLTTLANYMELRDIQYGIDSLSLEVKLIKSEMLSLELAK